MKNEQDIVDVVIWTTPIRQMVQIPSNYLRDSEFYKQRLFTHKYQQWDLYNYKDKLLNHIETFGHKVRVTQKQAYDFEHVDGLVRYELIKLGD